jgi:hypothetical protein
MRGIIEAGVVLLVVYLFLQWEKQGGADGPSTLTTSLPNFSENIGSPAQGIINESATPGTEGNTAQTATIKSSTGSCGCGGAS